MLIKPLTLCISPRRAEIREDFPEPTTPTTATNRPGLMSKDRLECSQRNKLHFFNHLVFKNTFRCTTLCPKDSLFQQRFSIFLPGKRAVTHTDSSVCGREDKSGTPWKLLTTHAKKLVNILCCVAKKTETKANNEHTEAGVMLHIVVLQVVSAKKHLEALHWHCCLRWKGHFLMCLQEAHCSLCGVSYNIL